MTREEGTSKKKIPGGRRSKGGFLFVPGFYARGGGETLERGEEKKEIKKGAKKGHGTQDL